MPNRDLELSLLQKEFKQIIGVDEAGLGCLAGPTVIAGVILPNEFNIDGIKDSKKITSEKKREKLYEQIINYPNIKWTISIISPEEIDQINILQARLKGMKEVIEQLKGDYACVDGNKKPNTIIPCECIVKGDDKCLNIATASIIAKVSRDRIMNEYHKTYPEWNFIKNKGYGTKEHISRIHELKSGTPIHRKTFAPLKNYLNSF